MSSPDPSPTVSFNAADLNLLAAIRRHDQGLRAALCTLARHGVALRRDAPLRSRAWLDQLATHPLFKGGQFLFDLLEWEDFMLDGPPPPLLDTPELRLALDRLAAAVRSAGAGLADGAAAPMAIALGGAGSPTDLPALEAGFYLYHDVVLGMVDLLTDASAA